MSARTDLAVEMIDEDAGSLPRGIDRRLRKSSACSITEIDVKSELVGLRLGKSKGRYITIETDRLSSAPADFEEQAQNIADEIVSLLKRHNCGIENGLIIGLGNSDITPDALGPLAASKIIATRHLKSNLPIGHELNSLTAVSVLEPGVIGKTGIEAAEIVGAVCLAIRPRFVIVIDAIACSDISRLGTTIQITDTGISPGAGVQNRRKELSEITLSVPVIAIGIPTVVDMHTIVENVTGFAPDKHMPNMMVTPRDIDCLVERSARLIAFSINRALQPELSFEEIEALI